MTLRLSDTDLAHIAAAQAWGTIRSDVERLLAEVKALRAERDVARAAVEAVLGLHVSDGHAPDHCDAPDCWEGCVECTEPWPCADVRVIATAGYPIETKEDERG